MSLNNQNKRKRRILYSPVPNKFKKINDNDNNDDNNDNNNDNSVFGKLILRILSAPPVMTPDAEAEKKTEDDCRNPLCNHKTYQEDPEIITVPNITQIDNISDLIMLGKSYHCKKNTDFLGMNLRLMCNLISPLTELQNMIGMTTVKENITEQILFFLQGNHHTKKCGTCMDCSFGLKCVNTNTEMLHTVITGPPGVGKTELGKILGKIYKELGILSKGTFKLVSRAELIAGYLGQTAIKTQRVIDECKGGVLFIDEAYSLGNKELSDSFSKECIDTLNKNLSEQRDFLCIIAGYKDQLENCFFKYNDGLRRRFTFRYDVTSYSSIELLKIFELKVSNMNWKLCYTEDETDSDETKKDKDIMRSKITTLFKNNHKNFPNYGGDIETFLLKCKISHSKRCLFIGTNKRMTLSLEDIENGFKLFNSGRKGENNDIEPLSVYS